MDNEAKSRGDSRARQRIEKRKQRQSMVGAPISSDEPTPRTREARSSRQFEMPSRVTDGLDALQDVWWYLKTHTPLNRVLWGFGSVVFLLIMISVFFSPNIGYNVWALGVPLSGKSVNDAQEAILNTWMNDIKLEIMLNGESIRQVSPIELGLKIDPYAIAQEARAVGIQGFPMGYEVQPVVTLDEAIAQTVLLDLVTPVYLAPYEAGYEWRDEQLVGILGRTGRELDVFLTLDTIKQNAVNITRTRRVELVTRSLPPTVVDPMPYLEQARAFLNGSFTLVGYDPFQDVQMPWTSTREEITRWLMASPNGLALRTEAFRPFVNAINSQLASEAQPRYLDDREVSEQVSKALLEGSDTAYLRVRYLSTTMTLASGDWGQRISRKTGIPFRLIENVNPNVDWNQLSIGATINLPSRDELLVLDPIPNKRIVVDLDRRYLVAYENGEVVFHWRISVGRTEAPTYPGIFQVLSHEEKAYGSGFSLCTSTGCSQWEMAWFMGIYEVVPGLMNGFHGAVLLPNGAYLDDGQVGNASTYGCVMANNQEAEAIFRWAEMGTVVEIIASEFPPQSELGRQAMNFISDRLSADNTLVQG